MPLLPNHCKGQFPVDMLGQLQYEDGLKVFVIHLLVSQLLALNRWQALDKKSSADIIQIGCQIG